MERLSLAQIALLMLYAVGMTAGQVLFKLAANNGLSAEKIGERLLAITANGYFFAAVAVYASLTIVWVWLLSFTPLSHAYMFIALSFALTAMAGMAIFGEPISARMIIGIGLILAGLLCVAA